jgi:hypothetical protein
MIEAAAKAHFQWYPNPDLKKRLEEHIGTECRTFSGKRENIAHGIVDLRFSDSSKLKLGIGSFRVFTRPKNIPFRNRARMLIRQRK